MNNPVSLEALLSRRAVPMRITVVKKLKTAPRPSPDKFAGKRSCRILIFTRGRTTQKGMTVRPRRDPARRLHISARTQFDLCLHPLPFLAASRATHSAPARRRPRLCTWNHTPDDLLSAGHFSPRPHSEGDSRLIALASDFRRPRDAAMAIGKIGRHLPR